VKRIVSIFEVAVLIFLFAGLTNAADLEQGVTLLSLDYPSQQELEIFSSRKPLKGGDWIGNPEYGWGTVGFPVPFFSGEQKVYFFITNNHVASFCSTGSTWNMGGSGLSVNPLFSPRQYSNFEDVILWTYGAPFISYIPVKLGGKESNLIDLAIVFPNYALHNNEDYSLEIKYVGKIDWAPGKCKPFQAVYKVGAMTGYKEGVIGGCDGKVLMQGTDGQKAFFTDQIVVYGKKDFLACGDSGSILVEKGTNRILGITTAILSCENGRKSWWGKISNLEKVFEN
jgi:hypothetical protein